MTNLEQQAMDAWTLSKTARRAVDNKERIKAIGQLQRLESSNTHIQAIVGVVRPIPDNNPPKGGSAA